jgi:predicted ArsR family transcriptional regulator
MLTNLGHAIDNENILRRSAVSRRRSIFRGGLFMTSTHVSPLAQVEIPLERDVFMRTLIRYLAETLEEVVGLSDAAGFVSVVGQKMGDEINTSYKQALALPRLSRKQVAEVLVDLKRRIQGDFYIIDQNDEKIVLGNRACPFAEKVLGRESLCMMTSNVFGAIAAENLGYAKVVLEKTIARGDPGCRIVVHLKPTDEAEAQLGREYFQSEV